MQDLITANKPGDIAEGLHLVSCLVLTLNITNKHRMQNITHKISHLNFITYNLKLYVILYYLNII